MHLRGSSGLGVTTLIITLSLSYLTPAQTPVVSPDPNSRTSSGAVSSVATDEPNKAFDWRRIASPAKPSDGIALTRPSSSNFKAVLKGYIQFDSRGYGARPNGENTLAIRRARLGVEGSIFKATDFKIQLDFSNLNQISVRDAYVSHRVRDGLKLWVGNMKAPWGQEELHGDSALEFVERSMVNNLVPPRSLGVMSSGAFRKGLFQYEIGLFSGNKWLSREPNDPAEVVLHLRFSPWIKSKGSLAKGLSVGAAYAQSNPDKGYSVRGRTASRGFTFFEYSTISGPATRTSGEMSWLAGPASFRAEYGQTNQARRGLGPDGTDLPGVVAKAFMTQFTFLLTGETKPDSKNVEPKRNFFVKDAGKRGIGAWELKLRYDNLAINESSPKSNRADSIYFGANWYLNPRIRYLHDLGLERVQDPLRTAQPGKRTAFVMLGRLQFTL